MLYFAMMQSLDEAERRKGKKTDADEEKEELKVEKEVYKKEKEFHSTSRKRIKKRKEKEKEGAEEKAHNNEGDESAERGFKRERVQRKRSGKNDNNNSSSFINEENSLKMISHDLIDSSFSSSFSPSITVLTMSLFKYLAIV